MREQAAGGAALIACPDCRGPVSHRARACPRCGGPVWKRRPPSVAKTLFLTLWLVALAGLVLWRGYLSPWLVVPAAAMWIVVMHLGGWQSRRQWYQLPTRTGETSSPEGTSA